MSKAKQVSPPRTREKQEGTPKENGESAFERPRRQEHQPIVSALGRESDPTIDDLLALTPEESREVVRRAYEFADHFHAGQKRKSGEPYVFHPITVACYLAQLHMDGPSIAAGLLHDVLEDTEMTPESLAEIFPEPIPQIVQGVTKITRIRFSTRREAQVENLRMMILAMARDVRVVIVKLCDRLHNMKTLSYLKPEKRIEISQETLDIYAPLANRLGIASIKSDLEDLAMRWIHPDAYEELTRLVSRKRHEREKLLKNAIDYLYEYLSPNHPTIIIKGRPKHFYSIFTKMRDQKLTFEEIYDLNAIRIICEEESECYEILGLIHAIWPAMPGRLKDYISMPKKNLYQSIHTTVLGMGGHITEIQIRTREMHRVAELGIAAHWAYKEGSEIQNDDRLAWLRQLTEWITDPNEPEGFLEALRRDPFADRVLCFTPRGDVQELPAQATPIDFAYSIHTRIGEQCVGAKINGRMVNLRTQLNNGDVVEILTSKTGHPSRDWLEYVVTGRARQKIKHWLKAKNIDEWVDRGRKALLRLIQERHLEVPPQQLESALAGILDAYKMQTVSDLLVEVGFGSLSAHAVLARANPDWMTSARKPSRQTQSKTKNRKKKAGAILVEGADDTPARVANCCSPIPGDRIVAYVTRGRGITVHSDNCPNVLRAKKDPQECARLLRASWTGEEGAHFGAAISVMCEDRSGLLNDITGVIASEDVFIKGCQTKSDMTRGKAILWFDVNVRNAEQLEQMLKAIRNQRGVIKAERKRAGKDVEGKN